MRQLVVISGKGGTGKTSVVASLAALAHRPVLADCDVDAADLHLVLQPTIRRRERFSGGAVARILPGHCVACGKCEELCRFDAIFYDGPGNGRVGRTFRVDPLACEGCGVCAHFCTYDAIRMEPALNGFWFLSDTRFGPMVHAELGVAQENSGKLVSLVRNEARQVAERDNRSLVIVDGSPGIGCPVIASVTGADMVLVVTEPTPSGLHDLKRVAQLARHFGIFTAVCLNKADLYDEAARTLEAEVQQLGLPLVGRIRYDGNMTAAQVAGKSLVEFTDEGAAADVRAMWECLAPRLACDGSVALDGQLRVVQ